MPSEKGVGDQDEVLAAIAQGRDIEVHDREAVVEVFAEPAGLQLGPEILVRRRDDPHINPDHLAAADPLDLPLLQKPQQLHLERHAHLGDLVEEQRAALGQLESALTLDVRARVGALLVTEQLGLEQRLGDGATVDGYEGARLSRAVRMDGLGEEFLTGAALTLDEHRRIRLRHARDGGEDLAHGRRGAQDVLEADIGLLSFEMLRSVGLQRLEIGGPLEDHLQPANVDGLGVVIEGAELDGPDRVDPIAVPGDDDDFRGRRSLHDVVQGFQPFLGPVLRGRKTEVQAHELGTVLVDRRQRRPAVLGEEQREVVAQRILQLRTDGLIVVHNEKFRLIHHASGAAGRMRPLATR